MGEINSGISHVRYQVFSPVGSTFTKLNYKCVIGYAPCCVAGNTHTIVN